MEGFSVLQRRIRGPSRAAKTTDHCRCLYRAAEPADRQLPSPSRSRRPSIHLRNLKRAGGAPLSGSRKMRLRWTPLHRATTSLVLLDRFAVFQLHKHLAAVPVAIRSQRDLRLRADTASSFRCDSTFYALLPYRARTRLIFAVAVARNEIHKTAFGCLSPATPEASNPTAGSPMIAIWLLVSPVSYVTCHRCCNVAERCPCSQRVHCTSFAQSETDRPRGHPALPEPDLPVACALL